MNTIGNKNILAITVLLCILVVPVAEGMHPVVTADHSARPEVTRAIISAQNPLASAENEVDAAKEKKQKATVPTNRATDPQAGSKTDSNKQPAKSKKAPLKPFKPSEEIAAEQAVDFPVDI